jgi:glycosyltransferase involved in cell wall biosynthesis
MNPLISVIIPTHNPNPGRLELTLAGLRSQTLDHQQWQLIVVDNGSTSPQFFNSLDLHWHPHASVISEKRLGLTRARLAGIQSAQGDYLIFVDDDNVLCPSYLKHVSEIFRNYPTVGAIGGKSIPEFEVTPEPWVNQFWSCLALRDLGDKIQLYAHNEQSDDKQHPIFAPIGAGMALRRSAARFYRNCILSNESRLALDRTGKSLQSGGDCDINLTILGAGWAVGYFPQLQVTHLISANRLTKDYLARLNYASSRSWVQVLDAHNIRPWKRISRWTVFLRKAKAFLEYQAWKSPVEYLHWQGACGMFEGLGELSN